MNSIGVSVLCIILLCIMYPIYILAAAIASTITNNNEHKNNKQNNNKQKKYQGSAEKLDNPEHNSADYVNAFTYQIVLPDTKVNYKLLQDEIFKELKGFRTTILSASEFKQKVTVCYMLFFVGNIVPVEGMYRAAYVYLITTKPNKQSLKAIAKKHVIRVSVDKLKDIWEYPSEFKSSEILKKTNRYKVGESIFTGIAPSSDILPFDDDYYFRINSTDLIMQNSLKRGVPFSKVESALICAYLENPKTIKKTVVFLDAGTNIGTISIPVSRAFSEEFFVYSFEPYPPTRTILIANIEENNCTNIIPFPFVLGHTSIDDTTLSDRVLNCPELLAINPNEKILKLSLDDDRPSHNGAVQLGLDGFHVRMIRIDDLVDDEKHVSVLKVDVEGAEPLVLYGSQKTIARCMPVIIFEKNENIITDDMKKSMALEPEVVDFSILRYCKSLGYKDLYEIEHGNFMVVPPGRTQTTPNYIHAFRPVKRISIHINGQEGYTLYKLIHPKWKV